MCVVGLLFVYCDLLFGFAGGCFVGYYLVFLYFVACLSGLNSGCFGTYTLLVVICVSIIWFLFCLFVCLVCYFCWCGLFLLFDCYLYV